MKLKMYQSIASVLFMLIMGACSSDPGPAVQDGRTLDGNAHDALTIDARAVDAAAMDAVAMDAHTYDAASVDAQAVDAQAVDAQFVDAQAVDASADVGPDAFVDCLGVPGGKAKKDNCGVCDTDSTNDCVKDCKGTWGGKAKKDRCDICDSDTSNDCRIVSIYFGGTGTNSSWYQTASTTWASPELLASLHYSQAVGSDEYKIFISGVSQGCIITPNVCLGTCFRCFNTTLWEAENALKAQLKAWGTKRHTVVNIFTYSRGGISGIRLVGRARKLAGVKRVNLVAIEPVAGDAHLDSYRTELCISPDRLVTIHAQDERSSSFNAFIPFFTGSGKMFRFAVRGSHETLVGNLQKDGHSYVGGLFPDWSVKYQAVSVVAQLTRDAVLQLARSPQWGRLKFTSTFYKQYYYVPAPTEAQIRSSFITSAGSCQSSAMLAVFNGMRNYFFPPGGKVENGCTPDRCADLKTDCKTTGIVWGKKMLSGPNPNIPILSSSTLSSSTAWSTLVSLGKH